MNKKVKLKTVQNKENNLWQLEIIYFEVVGGAEYEDNFIYPDNFVSQDQAYSAGKNELMIKGFNLNDISYE